jgi:hypothetical protein
MFPLRHWALLLLLAGPAPLRAEPPPPFNALVWEHSQTLKEIQRWKHAQTEGLDEVLMRRLDDLAGDEDAPEQAVVRRVRETVKAGRAPVLSEARGGPALLQQAIVIDMEDRDAMEKEAATRLEKVHRDLQTAFKDLAEGYDAKGDEAGAQAVRAEAMKWNLARVRSTALSFAVQPEDKAEEKTDDEPGQSGAASASPAEAPAANELRLRAPVAGPVTLSRRQPLRLTITYRHAQSGRAVIRARPFFRDGIAEGFSGSRVIFGEGSGAVTLEIGSRSPAVLDSILIQMIDPEDGSVLVEQQTRLEATWQ